MRHSSRCSRSLTHRIGSLILATATASIGVAGCSADDPGLGVATEDIIGGVPARSAKLNAIGTIGQANWDGTFYPICTGTLISPTVVLTAEHCVNFVSDPALELAFLIGPDAAFPIRVVPVAGVAWESSQSGGIGGLGLDLAVMHLAQPVDDVTPLQYAAVTPDLVDRRFTGVGYGIQNAYQASGTRRAGSMTLQATGGRLYEAIYGDFQSFLEDAGRYGWDPNDPYTEQVFQQAWDESLLLDGLEGWFGNGPHDAQTCFGDSGGPITLAANGKPVVYGVASWVAWYDSNYLCDLGAAYATLGPVGIDFIDAQIACPMVPAEGACDGNTVVRCVPPEEGGYYESRTDCGELGQTCGIDEAGQLGCIDDPCAGIPAEGFCDGTVATRCSYPEEGPRRVVSTDCAELGGTCGFENGEVACVDETGAGSCDHDVCEQGTPLDTSCSECTAQVCSVDPYCCETSWDGICVNEAASMCGASCPGAPASTIGVSASMRSGAPTTAGPSCGAPLPRHSR
ncbi:MAG: trypsin-like serine protease [Kofleriaceae bacterium]